MCGIVAFFAYGTAAAPVDLAELRRVRDHMALRGPDGAGELVSPDGRVGLGHRRLSIIDLRAIADQPMVHDDGRLAIVFNGEIYNYKALKAELEAQGRTFRTESDTEVLLQLYDRDGAEMTRHLRGMYAFAIWDRARGGMLLAREQAWGEADTAVVKAEFEASIPLLRNEISQRDGLGKFEPRLLAATWGWVAQSMSYDLKKVDPETLVDRRFLSQ